MAGYDHSAGMSNNAVVAYGAGLRPLSRLEKRDYLAGIDLPVAFCRFLAQMDFWPASEWHHTGGTWYNRTDFYDPSTLAELLAETEPEELQALRERWEAAKAAKRNPTLEKPRRVKGNYPVWGGSRRHRKRIGIVEFTGILVDGWILIDNGGRKRADGNWIEWDFVDTPGMVPPQAPAASPDAFRAGLIDPAVTARHLNPAPPSPPAKGKTMEDVEDVEGVEYNSELTAADEKFIRAWNRAMVLLPADRWIFVANAAPSLMPRLPDGDRIMDPSAEIARLDSPKRSAIDGGDW